MSLLSRLPDGCGVDSEVSLLLVRHHQQHCALTRVELLAVLHLLVGGPGRVQLAGAEMIVKLLRETPGWSTDSTPPLPEIISSMVVSEYRPTGQLYLGVLTCK